LTEADQIGKNRRGDPAGVFFSLISGKLLPSLARRPKTIQRPRRLLLLPQSSRPLPLLAALALGAALLVPPPAFAQADDDSGTATIVRTRAPITKRQPLVRNKYFVKARRLEITPRFGYISNNALNSEILLGLGLTYHFSERIGIEVAGDYAPLGGTSNTKNLALAVLRLLDASFRLESVDPGLFTTVSLIWYPMYGKLNPFAIAVINLDFFFQFGIGYGNEQIEMLAHEPVEQCMDPGENPSLGCDFGFEGQSLGVEPRINHLFLLNFGFGAKIYLAKMLSLRLDARLYVTTDAVLDFDTEEAAAQNRGLGQLANRLDCNIDPQTGDQFKADAACKTVFPTSFVLSVGMSFWVPGDKAARRSAGSRR
jgi:outer membrane beta-barrel protein